METHPSLELETDEMGTLILTWLNTVIKTYRNDALNHIRWVDEEGDLYAFKVGTEVLDALFERDFPYTFDPVPDEATENWWIEQNTDKLDEEISTLYGG